LFVYIIIIIIIEYITMRGAKNIKYIKNVHRNHNYICLLV